MSVAELQAYRQQRLSELEQARARIKAIQEPAALDMWEAVGELNQTKQLIERIQMDIYRVEEEIKIRPADVESDDSDVVVDEAPPDPKDVQ